MLNKIKNPLAKKEAKTMSQRWKEFINKSFYDIPVPCMVEGSSDNRCLRDYRKKRKIRNAMAYHSRKLNRGK